MAKKKSKRKEAKVVDLVEEEDLPVELQDEENKDGARIEIARQMDDNNEWEYFWLLYSGNGRRIATNVEPYKRLNDLKEAIKSVRENMNAPLVRLY